MGKKIHWRVVFQRQGASSNNRDATDVVAETRQEAIQIVTRKYKVERIISCEPA